MAIWRRLWKHQKSGWDQQFAPTTSKNAGFTLIELLVSIILASLVVTPLLGFMINILQSDQREQAKYATEQDLRAAADYIAKDLEEAVYIYDRAGLASITDDYATVTCTGGCDSDTSAGSNLPADPDIVPVLVFWRRVFVPGIEIGEPDDAFAYSLVAYYLINDDDPTWSGASRIGRFEIAGAVTDPFNASISLKNPDPGYNPFNLSETGTLQEKMNDWYKADEPYDRDPIVLVDYIYSSSDDPPPFESCPEADGWTQVPDYGEVDAKFQTYGFYACVKSNSLNPNDPGANEIARVFLRGNVLARLNDRDNIPSYNDDTSKVSFRNASFFPQTRIEVKGNGGL